MFVCTPQFVYHSVEVVCLHLPVFLVYLRVSCGPAAPVGCVH